MESRLLGADLAVFRHWLLLSEGLAGGTNMCLRFPRVKVVKGKRGERRMSNAGPWVKKAPRGHQINQVTTGN